MRGRQASIAHRARCMLGAFWSAGPVSLACLILGLTMMAPVAAASRGRTAVHVFKPWTATGQPRPGLHVASRSKGSCWTESVAVAGQYRCMSGNAIYDPCWVKPASKDQKVGCVLAPWDRGIHVIRLTKKLPAVSKPRHLTSTRFAWAIKLASGMVCTLGQGTDTTIDGKPMVYYCRKGVAGEIDRSKEPWRTEYSRSYRHGPLIHKVISQAWY